jgi:hypothetical protein
MAFHNVSLVVVLAVLGQQVGSTIASAAPDSGPVVCIGTKAISDTVGIVIDRKTGAREQSLVEARLAIVSHGNVIGTMYVDDEGLRYIELKRGATIPGLAGARGDGAVHPLGMRESFDGEVRLRACRSDSH